MLSPETSDREQIRKVSFKDMDDPNELAPHLRDDWQDEVMADEEMGKDPEGPVPVKAANDYYVTMDPYSRDWGINRNRLLYNK